VTGGMPAPANTEPGILSGARYGRPRLAPRMLTGCSCFSFTYGVPGGAKRGTPTA
jgi:hypothetical protein